MLVCLVHCQIITIFKKKENSCDPQENPTGSGFSLVMHFKNLHRQIMTTAVFFRVLLSILIAQMWPSFFFFFQSCSNSSTVNYHHPQPRKLNLRGKKMRVGLGGLQRGQMCSCDSSGDRDQKTPLQSHARC